MILKYILHLHLSKNNLKRSNKKINTLKKVIEYFFEDLRLIQKGLILK